MKRYELHSWLFHMCQINSFDADATKIKRREKKLHKWTVSLDLLTSVHTTHNNMSVIITSPKIIRSLLLDLTTLQ